MITNADVLSGGFSDPVLDSQDVFRALMDAMARPGTVQRIHAAAGTPAPLMRGTAAIALTLFDHDTPVWLDPAMSATLDVGRWLKFHTSAPVIAESSASHFAVIGHARELPPLGRFALGSSEYPDRSTTLILQVESLTDGSQFELRGPGIDGAAVLRSKFQPADLFDRLAVNAALFPRGIDVVLVADDAIVAIPRTTRLAAKGD